jgi:hypothetical protein
MILLPLQILEFKKPRYLVVWFKFVGV